MKEGTHQGADNSRWQSQSDTLTETRSKLDQDHYEYFLLYFQTWAHLIMWPSYAKLAIGVIGETFCI